MRPRAKHNVELFLTLAALMLFGVGCNNTSASAPKNDGGVYRSSDAGKTWLQKVALPTVDGVKSLARVDAVVSKLDPTDSNTMYVGSLYNGMFVTYNKGESWQQVTAAPTALIRDIAVDPKQRCVIYVTDGLKLFKSSDCSRTFKEIYIIPQPNFELRVIAVAPDETNNVYLGSSSGDLYESRDGGQTWRQNRRFSSRITDIQINSKHPEVMFVGTSGSGLFRSSDRGATWENLSDKMSQAVQGGRDNLSAAYAIIIDKDQEGLVYYATKIGVLKSVDDGETWDIVPLLSAPGEARIYSFAVNPKNNKELWYGATIGDRPILYESVDAGDSWNIVKVPTTRIPIKIVIDPIDPNMIYLGTYYRPPQK